MGLGSNPQSQQRLGVESRSSWKVHSNFLCQFRALLCSKGIIIGYLAWPQTGSGGKFQVRCGRVCSMEATSMIKRGCHQFHSYANLIQEIKELVFVTTSFNCYLILREVNVSALAKHGFSCPLVITVFDRVQTLYCRS